MNSSLPLVFPRTATIFHAEQLRKEAEQYLSRGVITSNQMIADFFESQRIPVKMKSREVIGDTDLLKETLRDLVWEWQQKAPAPWRFLAIELRVSLVEIVKHLLLLQDCLTGEARARELPILWPDKSWETAAQSLGIRTHVLVDFPDALSNSDIPPLVTPKSTLRSLAERWFKLAHHLYSAYRPGREAERDVLIIPHRETLALAARMDRGGYKDFGFLSWHSSLKTLKLAQRLGRPLHVFELKSESKSHLPPSNISELMRQIFERLAGHGIWKIERPNCELLGSLFETKLLPLAKEAQALSEGLAVQIKKLKPKVIVAFSPQGYSLEAIFYACRRHGVKSLALSHAFGGDKNLVICERTEADYVGLWGQYDFLLARDWKTKYPIRSRFLDTGPAQWQMPGRIFGEKRDKIAVLLNSQYPLLDLFELSDYREEELLTWLSSKSPHIKDRVWLRPHPVEHPDYKSYLRSRYGFQCAEHLPLGELFSTSSILISPYSTALIEAHQFGLAVIWVDISGRGADYPPLESLPHFWRVRSQSEFEKALDEALHCKIDNIPASLLNNGRWLSDHWEPILKRTLGLKALDQIEADCG